MLLRTDQKFEFSDPLFSAAFPSTRHYHVVQQVLNVPLWIVDFFPTNKGNVPASEPQRWSRQLTSSIRGLAGLLLNSESMRAQVHALLPAHISPQGEIQLARCSAIWNAHPFDDPEEVTWLIETDHGPLSDPDFSIEACELQKSSLHWKDEVFQKPI